MVATPVERCCELHRDWSVMATHLIRSFPDVPPRAIAAEVQFARRAVEDVQLADEEMLVGELIARYRLLVRAGLLPDAARLDPQTHTGRSLPRDVVEV